MSLYTVQPGDTPMIIAQKMTGNPGRVTELVRSNAHKPAVRIGPVLTFQNLNVGEQLTIPPRWLPSLGKGRRTGTAGYAHAQKGPHFEVRPRAGGGGGGDDSGHGVEPILTVSGPHGTHRSNVPVAGTMAPFAGLPTGVGAGACCGSCAAGGPCETDCVKQPICSVPSATPSIPGSTSFPVGFGQTAPAASTASTVGDALAGWGVPLAIGVISIAAGFGLAYAISNR